MTIFEASRPAVIECLKDLVYFSVKAKAMKKDPSRVIRYRL
ncbi:MAG: hypothetical protein QXZ63_06710 [Sulfolobales archaeon]